MQFKYLKYDLYRYFYFAKDSKDISIFTKIVIILTTQGAWAMIVYRTRRWFESECKSKILKKIFSPIGIFLSMLVQIFAGIDISSSIDIGPGLYIGHFGNIFLGGYAKIGKMCNISQECTVGIAGRGDSMGWPEIGNFVYIAPGAKIIGKIKIGDYVAIGANAVVTKSLPDYAVAVGIPAKVISDKGSHDFMLYNTKKFESILSD